jgi:2-hydroxy-3-oxopropionate reductase
MGLPMSVHLQKAGYEVTGYDVDPGVGQELVAAGGQLAGSVAEAVQNASIIAIMVPDSPHVTQVLTNPDGVFANASPGTLVIDFSSIRPDVTVGLATQAKELGLRIIDAPVSGGQPGAVAATLSIMVGGAEEDVEAARPVLEIVGGTVVRVGPTGSGQTVKAANQLIVAANIEALAEAVVFLEAYGVDLDAAITVLGGGLAGSAVLNQKAQKMLDHEFTPGFRIDLHHKDMGIVTSAAREAGVVIPLGSLMAQLVAAVRAGGDGGLDHSALYRGVKRLSGQQAG